MKSQPVTKDELQLLVIYAQLQSEIAMLAVSSTIVTGMGNNSDSILVDLERMHGVAREIESVLLPTLQDNYANQYSEASRLMLAIKEARANAG